jgi:hypothetical protein
MAILGKGKLYLLGDFQKDGACEFSNLYWKVARTAFEWPDKNTSTISNQDYIRYRDAAVNDTNILAYIENKVTTWDTQACYNFISAFEEGDWVLLNTFVQNSNLRGVVRDDLINEIYHTLIEKHGDVYARERVKWNYRHTIPSL